MFHDPNGTLAPSFVYPGNCLNDAFFTDTSHYNWTFGPSSGYNVWNWIVANFTNEIYTPNVDDKQPCVFGYESNITSVFSATWPSQCPSPCRILTTFAVINVVVAFSSLVLGNQRVLHFLSCKLLGKEHGKPNVGSRVIQVLQLFLPLGLQLLANAIITILTKATPGYQDGFTFGQLFLFLAARPRTTWILALWAARIPLRDPTKVPGFDAINDPTGTVLPITDQDRRSHRKREIDWFRDDTPINGVIPRNRALSRRPHNHLQKYKAFFPYSRFARGQLLAEVVLLAMASYSIGGTTHFASQSGFYEIIFGGSERNYQANGQEHESAAKMMYAGAIWWIICFPFAFITFWCTVIVGLYAGKENLGLINFVVSLMLMPSLWLGQWLWLVGFANLMGPLYCPPNLTTQASIWISASVVGIVFGAGFG